MVDIFHYEHYVKKAEECLDRAYGDAPEPVEHWQNFWNARAQVYATLAVATKPLPDSGLI